MALFHQNNRIVLGKQWHCFDFETKFEMHRPE
jgi:hypothetical protein